MADALEEPILHHHKILRFFDFQGGGRPLSSLGFLELKILTETHSA